MKTFAAATFVALASVATAQLSAIPQCALNCFLTPLGSDGCSQLTDFACHCKKADSLIASVTPCVQGACSASDQAATLTAVEKTCADAGVPVSISSPAASGSATPAPSSQAASSAAASKTGGASSAVASAASSAASAASSAAASASSAIASAKSSAAAGTTAMSNGTSPTGTSSPSVSSFTGAAAVATQAAGLLGAAAVALFAL